MTAIYSDSQVIDLDWIPNLKFHDAIEVFHSFENYRDSAHSKKIAFTAHRLHCTYDRDCKVYQGFEDKIVKLSQISNLVFSLESELHNFHWQIWHHCHRPNVYWIQPGMVNDSDMQDHIIHWADFFKLNTNLYKKLSHKLDELTPYQSKPMMFDAMLGSIKPHRQFVYDSVIEHGLQDHMILTYGGRWNNNEFYAKDYFVWEPNCVPQQAIIGTADFVDYLGQVTPLSHVIPINVYNQTAYSIVCETDHDNTLSFFSEKTAKVLIARRLFVAFSGYKFLQNLRSLGFRTFDGIIDESYDQIRNDRERYTAAFEQIRWLCSQPQEQILAKIRPIVDHNHDLIMNTDWTLRAVTDVQQHVDQICMRS